MDRNAAIAVSCSAGENAAQPSESTTVDEIADVRIADGRRDAAVGDDAGDIELVDAHLAQ